MRNLIVALLLLLAPAPALAQGSAQAEAPRTLEQLGPELDAFFTAYQREMHIPGIAYGIVQDGRLVRFRAFGERDIASHRPIDADTLFRIASMSKAFTALAILKLTFGG